MLDAVGTRFWPYYKGRDAERTPMPWQGGPGGGFSAPGVRTWLPMADPAACNVADQEGDPDVGARVLPAGHRGAGGRATTSPSGVLPVAGLARGHVGLRPRRGAPRVLLNMSDARRLRQRARHA